MATLGSSVEPNLSSIGVDLAPLLVSTIRVAPTIASPGAPFSALYVFGDSLSDTGNVSLATSGLVPVSPPYANRSFSNGAVWAQDLAQSIGLPALKPSLAGGTDFAYGGAHTGQTSEHTANPTDLSSQYDQFRVQVSSPQAGALYAISIGSNDVLDVANDTSLTQDQQQTDVAAAVNNEISTINAMVSRGTRNLLVLDVPDLGNTPRSADQLWRNPPRRSLHCMIMSSSSRCSRWKPPVRSRSTLSIHSRCRTSLSARPGHTASQTSRIPYGQATSALRAAGLLTPRAMHRTNTCSSTRFIRPRMRTP